MGTETPVKVVELRFGPAEGTNLPITMPTAIAMNTQRGRRVVSQGR